MKVNSGESHLVVTPKEIRIAKINNNKPESQNVEKYLESRAMIKAFITLQFGY